MSAINYFKTTTIKLLRNGKFKNNGKGEKRISRVFQADKNISNLPTKKFLLAKVGRLI